jgi:hypothetical protein
MFGVGLSFSREVSWWGLRVEDCTCVLFFVFTFYILFCAGSRRIWIPCKMVTARESDTRALNDLITSTLALLSQFSASLASSTSTSVQPIANPPNPLRVLSDSARLTKAHTTKLSLLAINQSSGDGAASAITNVLKELSGTCLPAAMSAVQICEQEKGVWGSLMSVEVQLRVKRLFREMEMLLGEIRTISSGAATIGRRDSLSSTGVVWESCDAIVELEQLGIAGLAVHKAQQYQDTIKDAIKELQEWKEGEDLDFEGQGDGLADSDDEGVDGDKDSLDDLFNAANSMPKDRPELAVMVVETDSKLKKVVILYQALVKRRIRTFEKDKAPDAVARLDGLMLHLRRMPHQVDDLVGKFYDLDDDGAKTGLEKVISEAIDACEGMKSSWERQEDEFTPWLSKWTAATG